MDLSKERELNARTYSDLESLRMNYENILGQKEIQSKDIHKLKENIMNYEDKIRNLKDD